MLIMLFPTFTWTIMNCGRRYTENNVELLLEQHLLRETPVVHKAFWLLALRQT